jgi:hypothetical protein
MSKKLPEQERKRRAYERTRAWRNKRNSRGELVHEWSIVQQNRRSVEVRRERRRYAREEAIRMRSGGIEVPGF